MFGNLEECDIIGDVSMCSRLSKLATFLKSLEAQGVALGISNSHSAPK